jgi:hypothetical protein
MPQFPIWAFIARCRMKFTALLFDSIHVIVYTSSLLNEYLRITLDNTCFYAKRGLTYGFYFHIGARHP